MKLEDLINCIPESEYGPSPFRKMGNGTPLTVLTDTSFIFRKLTELGVPFSWETVAAGYTDTGRSYFAGNLTLTLDGKNYRMAGSADEEKVGIAGNSQIALENAFCRGFRAGEFVYQGKLGSNTEEISSNVVPLKKEFKPVPTQQVQENKGTVAPPKRQYNRFKSSAPAQETNGEWSGEGSIGFGKYKGTKWKSVDIGYLNFITNGDKPNQDALKELNRRMHDSNSAPNLNIEDAESWVNG